MEAVIKVGGSLTETPGSLKALGCVLRDASKKHCILVVPGGGRFADTVREIDAKFSLPASIAHRMAILAMDQYGLVLTHVFRSAYSCDLLEEARTFAGEGRLTVFLPSKLLLQEGPFLPSWSVTSDSITAYLAAKLKASKAVFVTDVDGIYTEDPANDTSAKLLKKISPPELLNMGKRTSVDKFLPQFLMKNQLNCYVVNGKYPERVAAILSNKQTI